MADRPDQTAARERMRFVIGARRELRNLRQHLRPDDTVLEMAAGSYRGGSGLLVATEHGILFTRYAWGSSVTEAFPLGRVTSVQWKSGRMWGAVTLAVGDRQALITKVEHTDGERFVETVRSRMGVGATSSRFAGGSDRSGRVGLRWDVREHMAGGFLRRPGHAGFGHRIASVVAHHDGWRGYVLLEPIDGCWATAEEAILAVEADPRCIDATGSTPA